MPVAADLALIGPDFVAIRSQFLTGSPFMSILAKLTHIRSQLAAILSNLVTVSAYLLVIRLDLSPVRPKFPAIASS